MEQVNLKKCSHKELVDDMMYRGRFKSGFGLSSFFVECAKLAKEYPDDSKVSKPKKIFAPRVSKSPHLKDLVDTVKDGDSKPAQ